MTKCWICGSSDSYFVTGKPITERLVSSDVAITDDRYGTTLPLYKCRNCSFVYAYPLPENILSLYEGLEDENYIESLKPRMKEMKYLLKVALKSKPDIMSVLDVGAGAGLLVNSALKQGLKAQGIEPSRWLVQQAKKLFNLEIIEGTIPNEELNNKKYDAVFAVDVIEHISNPIEFLGLLKQYLKDDGIIVIATPDCESFLASKLKNKWWHYRLAHIGLFSKRSFKEATNKSGLKIIKITRQVWYLPFGYLMKRLSNYLPLKLISNFVSKKKMFSDIPVRLNLHDNLVLILSK